MKKLVAFNVFLAALLFCAPAAAKVTLQVEPTVFYPYSHDGVLDTTSFTLTVSPLKHRTCRPDEVTFQIHDSTGQMVQFARELGIFRDSPHSSSRTVTWVGNFYDDDVFIADPATYPYWYLNEFGNKIFLVPPGTYEVRTFVDYICKLGKGLRTIGPTAPVTAALD
jgi:hypothetical protein